MSGLLGKVFSRISLASNIVTFVTIPLSLLQSPQVPNNIPISQYNPTQQQVMPQYKTPARDNYRIVLDAVNKINQGRFDAASDVNQRSFDKYTLERD